MAQESNDWRIRYVFGIPELVISNATQLLNCFFFPYCLWSLDLDENKIVDLLSGEKDVFKRRGTPDEANNSSVQTEPIVIRLIVDISGAF